LPFPVGCGLGFKASRRRLVHQFKRLNFTSLGGCRLLPLTPISQNCPKTHKIKNNLPVKADYSVVFVSVGGYQLGRDLF